MQRCSVPWLSQEFGGVTSDEPWPSLVYHLFIKNLSHIHDPSQPLASLESELFHTYLTHLSKRMVFPPYHFAHFRCFVPH